MAAAEKPSAAVIRAIRKRWYDGSVNDLAPDCGLN